MIRIAIALAFAAGISGAAQAAEQDAVDACIDGVRAQAGGAGGQVLSADKMGAQWYVHLEDASGGEWDCYAGDDGKLEQLTAGCTGVNLTIAINYGGRDEVARATKRLAEDVAAGRLDPASVDEETLPKYLDTCVLPDPDLVIRTSGEARISNFLLWQSAYAEYEFVDTLWPDFSADEFGSLVSAYGSRERRYGGVKA